MLRVVQLASFDSNQRIALATSCAAHRCRMGELGNAVRHATLGMNASLNQTGSDGIDPNDHGLATLDIDHLGHSVCGCAMAAVVYNDSIIALGSGCRRSCGANASACASYK